MWIISGGVELDLEQRLLRELKSDIDEWDPGPTAFDRVLRIGRRRKQSRRRNTVAAGLAVLALGLLLVTLLPTARGAAGSVASNVLGPIVGSPTPPRVAAPPRRNRTTTPVATTTPPGTTAPQPPAPAPAPVQTPERPHMTPPPGTAPPSDQPVEAGPRSTPPPLPSSSASTPGPAPTPTCLLGVICI